MQNLLAGVALQYRKPERRIKMKDERKETPVEPRYCETCGRRIPRNGYVPAKYNKLHFCGHACAVKGKKNGKLPEKIRL